jgi:CheY-like chemotaxis protein
MTTKRHIVLKEFSALSFDVFMGAAPSSPSIQPQNRTPSEGARDFEVHNEGSAESDVANDRRESDKALFESQRSARLLIAEDSPGIRSSLAKVLRAEGYEVSLADNGIEALGRVTGSDFDAVLLDLDMPLGGGWEAFDWILRRNPQQAVIIISGRYAAREWARSGQPGVLVEKPIDVPALLECIREVLAEAPESRESRVASQRTVTRHTRPVQFLRWQGHVTGGINE